MEARRRYRLSHAQVAMARELGLNPRTFGQLANHRPEPWKAPLPVFIEDLYLKRFGRALPEIVIPVEERRRQDQLRRGRPTRGTGSPAATAFDPQRRLAKGIPDQAPTMALK